MLAQLIRIAPAREQNRRFLNAACIGLLLAYFLHFALPALRAGFGEDEMMNLYFYWFPGAFRSIRANFCFWSISYPQRPAGAVYFLPLYHFFSLDPLPYRIVQISILTATIPIFFYLARLLSGSRAVGFLVALAMCYHQELANLVFSGSFIYDVLCGFFYFAALTYYVRIREQGVALRAGQLAIFLALYLCALNSKEMAVSLPVIVFIYEVLKYPRIHDWKPFAFIPARGGAMLYIVLFGWAMIIARVLQDLVGLAGRVLAVSEPSTTMLRTLATAAVAVALAVFTQWQSQHFDQTRVLLSSGQKSLHVIQAFRSLNLHPALGSTILLEPKARFYQNPWYPKFVASLVWNDRSLHVYVAGQQQLTHEEIANMDYVISFNEFSAQLVRTAESDRS